MSKYGLETCNRPIDPTSLYIRLQFHEWWWGPFADEDAAAKAVSHLNQTEPMWDYDGWTVVRGGDGLGEFVGQEAKDRIKAKAETMEWPVSVEEPVEKPKKRRIRHKKQKLAKMSGETQEVEHIYVGIDILPDALVLEFPLGVCTVFGNKEFVGAIPANEEQTETLAWLLQTNKPKEYTEMRTLLCGAKGYEVVSQIFFGSMNYIRSQEEKDSVDKRVKHFMNKFMAEKGRMN